MFRIYLFESSSIDDVNAYINCRAQPSLQFCMYAISMSQKYDIDIANWITTTEGCVHSADANAMHTGRKSTTCPFLCSVNSI